jgi:hypothetical protein
MIEQGLLNGQCDLLHFNLQSVSIAGPMLWHFPEAEFKDDGQGTEGLTFYACTARMTGELDFSSARPGIEHPESDLQRSRTL